MNKEKKLAILALAFAVLLAGAYVLYNRLGDQVEHETLVVQTEPVPAEAPADTTAPAETAEETQAQKQDRTVPDFTVYDEAGNPHKLSDFRGKPVILNFWASWCGPCKSEMPDFQKSFEANGEKIHFLMVNCTDGSQETVETASDFLREEGYTFPAYFDTDVDAAMAYGVQAIPTTYFIDDAGELVAWGQGALQAESLQKGVDLLLNLK